MQINLTGHHIDITDALREYVDTKFAKLERHFDHINNVHVILNVEKTDSKSGSYASRQWRRDFRRCRTRRYVRGNRWAY